MRLGISSELVSTLSVLRRVRVGLKRPRLKEEENLRSLRLLGLDVGC